MDYGLFTMPSHPPERSLYDGHQWDLQTLRWADELGFSEAWIGEHHTAPWEPHPAPDLLVAQALLQTKSIRASAPAGSCCRTTIPPSWPTGSPCSITWPRAGSTSAWRPAGCRATGRCSTSTACPASTAR